MTVGDAAVRRLVVVSCQLRCGDGGFLNHTSAFSELDLPHTRPLSRVDQQKHCDNVQVERIYIPQVTR
jgi:hypothetical protein